MAQKLLKAGGKRKVAAKRPAKKTEDGSVVLVGTYHENQLGWIKKNGVYNYPLTVPSASSRTGADKQPDYSRIKELWLYAGAKTKRHCFAAEFVGIQSKAEFLAANRTYAKKVGKPSHAQYAVFKTKPFDYGPKLEGKIVVARAIDFAKGRGQTKKVAAAIRQFHADGEFAPLALYLPKELGKVPRPQLRVCEAAVQLDFSCSMFAPLENAMPRDEKTVISMFSGAMGLDNGIEQTGMKIRLCVEFQHAMAETIRANKPEIPLIEDDVRNYSGKDLRSRAGLSSRDEVFLVCGGPPCQAFSTAGKRLGFDDDRGNVFLKYLDLIGEIRPKYFLLENVRGLLSAAYSPDAKAVKPAKGTALLYALAKIKSIGYSATFTLYDSANYGVPQRRERVIILGSRDGYKIPLIPPTHSSGGERGLAKWRTFREAVQGVHGCNAAPIPKRRIKFFRMLGPGQYWKDLPKKVQEEAMGKSFALPGGKTGFYRRLAWDEPSPTLVTCPTMPATDLMHPVEDRALSVEEYARIQMFPDNWVFKGRMADIYKQIGNAVPVGMGYAAARHLLWFDSLPEDQKRKVELIDPNAVYSRYKNTNFLYFEKLMLKGEH